MTAAAVTTLELLGVLLFAAGTGVIAAAVVGGPIGAGVGLIVAAVVVLAGAWLAARRDAA